MSTGIQNVLTGALIILGILVCFALLYAVRGKRITDKIVAVNMIGTLGINMIVILSLILKAEYILDVALVFALLSFLTVIIFCRYAQNGAVYDRMRKERENSREDRDASGEVKP